MTYSNLKTIMKQIQHIMIDNDIRQKDISNNTGWTKQTVSNLLACRRDSINIDTLNTLCNAIDCDLMIDTAKGHRPRLGNSWVALHKRMYN